MLNFNQSMSKSDEEKSQIARTAIRTRTLNALKDNIIEIKQFLENKNVPCDVIPNNYDYIHFHINKPVIILFDARRDECVLHFGLERIVHSYSDLENKKLFEFIREKFDSL